MSVNTLQQRLEQKAEKRAQEDAARVVRGLPHFDSISTWAHDENGTNKGMVTVQRYWIEKGMEEAIYKKLYEEYLKEETDNLLDACQRVREVCDE